jgi:1-acyl-sn-glycerol-3-phosphate acyltransferase
VGEGWYAATTLVGRALLRGLDVTVRAEGAHHVPADGPVVLASNHVSFPDFVFIGRAFLDDPRLIRFMCRHEIWESPLRRPMLGMRHVPVDRQAPAGAYLAARRLLGDGEIVCVFPEAGISAAYTVRALMPGAAALAREIGAPLVPVTVWGSQLLWPQRRAVEEPFPRPTLRRGTLVDVRFHPPMQVPPDADLAETTRELGHRLWDGLEELQRLPEHRPRPGERLRNYPVHLGGYAVPRAESFELDRMPRSAVTPTWGPGL